MTRNLEINSKEISTTMRGTRFFHSINFGEMSAFESVDCYLGIAFDLINPSLQRGLTVAEDSLNRFNGFFGREGIPAGGTRVSTFQKPLKPLSHTLGPLDTSLKRGVN